MRNQETTVGCIQARYYRYDISRDQDPKGLSCAHKNRESPCKKVDSDLRTNTVPKRNEREMKDGRSCYNVKRRYG